MTSGCSHPGHGAVVASRAGTTSIWVTRSERPGGWSSRSRTRSLEAVGPKDRADALEDMPEAMLCATTEPILASGADARAVAAHHCGSRWGQPPGGAWLDSSHRGTEPAASRTDVF